MRRRRSRLFREDVLAPWLTLSVIVGLWWIGASIFGPAPSIEAVVPSPTVRRIERFDRPAPVTGPAAHDIERAAEGPLPGPGDSAVPARSDAGAAAPDVIRADDVTILRGKQLLVPVAGVAASSLHSSFNDARGSNRRHEAMDILAPRGTPVVAALGGRIVKLFTSGAGGLTIYQFDEEGRYCYYYAHLDRYAPGLEEGQRVARGQTIGYVGTTGNAPLGTPHLHFAIFRLGPDKRWWDGDPIDPMLALR